MWDERYASTDYVYGVEPNDFLRKSLSKIIKGPVLCLAEGEGRNAVFLAKQGYRVTAVDQSAVGLKKAEALAKKNGVQIDCIHQDLKDFEFASNTWGAIISIFCHLPPSIRAHVNNQIPPSLALDGILVLEGYTHDQLNRNTGGPKSIELMLSKDILLSELHGLAFDHLTEIERPINEGIFHTGLGCVVQAIARKRL